MLSVGETLLKSALLLHDSGKADFTEWDLTAAAFVMRPDLFCMPGYPSMPDHKKAYCRLLGSGGLITKGMIARKGPSLLGLSPSGFCVARYICLSPEDQEKSGRLYGTIASIVESQHFLRWRENPDARISWKDLGSIGAGSPEELAERLKGAEQIMSFLWKNQLGALVCGGEMRWTRKARRLFGLDPLIPQSEVSEAIQFLKAMKNKLAA